MLQFTGLEESDTTEQLNNSNSLAKRRGILMENFWERLSSHAVLGVHTAGFGKVPQDPLGSGWLPCGQQPAGRLGEHGWKPAGVG